MKTVKLTEDQVSFIRGCLEIAGCDEAGEGERLIALLEMADSVTLEMEDA